MFNMETSYQEKKKNYKNRASLENNIEINP